jgi:ribosomal protein S18 acetylase RimI-like enzyme
MDRSSRVRIGYIQMKDTCEVSGNGSIKLDIGAVNLNDATKVVDVIDNAFSSDPTWSWAFPYQEARRRFWELQINGALRYSWVFKTTNFETVSAWIPPGGTELSHEQEEQFPGLLEELVGSRAADVAKLIDRFDEAHPRTEPHYYLSLLGTHNKCRGLGLGMALLRENLARIDAEHMPAYLESSNPTNNKRYESVGFKQVTSFQAPGNGPIVTGMWRKKS